MKNPRRVTAQVRSGSSGERSTRTWTLGVVTPVHALRDRAAHHEPLVNGCPLPGENRRLSAEQGHQARLRLPASSTATSPPG